MSKVDNIAKKITIGSLNGLRGGFKADQIGDEPILAARIYGRADSFEAKDSTMGVSYKFVGDFLGANQYGELTSAPVAYLIAPADGLLVNALKESEGKGVEFAFDFFVVKNPTAVLGYEYKCKPLLDTKPAAPLLALQSSIPAMTVKQRPAAQLALPGAETPAAAAPAETPAAPAPEEKPVETPAPAPAASGKKK